MCQGTYVVLVVISTKFAMEFSMKFNQRLGQSWLKSIPHFLCMPSFCPTLWAGRCQLSMHAQSLCSTVGWLFVSSIGYLCTLRFICILCLLLSGSIKLVLSLSILPLGTLVTALSYEGKTKTDKNMCQGTYVVLVVISRGVGRGVLMVLEHPISYPKLYINSTCRST